MNRLGNWSIDPFARGSNGNSFLTVMGQESGHRWNSFLRFDKGSGLDSLLLGRSNAHWSTFLGFELSSTMDGGNEWVEIMGWNPDPGDKQISKFINLSHKR